METKTKVIGMLGIKGRYESAQRVYDTDNLAPALNSCTGGGLEPKIPVPKLVGGVVIKILTTERSIISKIGFMTAKVLPCAIVRTNSSIPGIR